MRKFATSERILAAAGGLFSVDGVRAASVDAIAAAAGVSKRTLYYHFRSKDDLIGQWLSREDGETRGAFRRWLGPPGIPMEWALIRLFEGLARSASVPRWKGCGFARAATELAGMPGHPGVRAARAHKRGLEAWLESRLAEDGLAGAGKLARRIALLLEGAIVQVIVHQDTNYMREAGEMAAELVAAAKVSPPGARWLDASAEPAGNDLGSDRGRVPGGRARVPGETRELPPALPDGDLRRGGGLARDAEEAA